MHLQPSHSHLWLYRAVMALIGVTVPLMGILAWVTPLMFDPFAARAGIGLLAFGGLAATYVSERARALARQGVLLLGAVILAWFSYLAGMHDVGADDVVGLLPCVVILPLVVANGRELAGVVVFTALATAAAAGMAVEPEFPPLTFVTLFVILTLGLGLSSLSRTRAEQGLAELAADLDARVESRTLALSEALARAEHETEERRVAEDRAVKASQAKSRFLANMSHELRTPLNAVIGYTEMVAEELEEREGSEALVTDLSQAKVAATHLLSLIDDVLDLSRVEAGELQLEIQPVWVGEVVDQAVAHTPQIASTAQRGLRVEVPDLRVRADAQRLTQVVINLLTNAAKFTHAGEVSIAAARYGDRVCLTVGDTGEGIAPHDLPHVFDRFHQGDASATRRHGGAGLGLAITQMLVEKMDGRIEVVSEPGRGSTFTVWLVAA